MIVVLFRELLIKSCRFGSDVFSDDAFQIIMLVSCSVIEFICVVGVGAAGSGGGCEYSFIFSKHLSVSVINKFGRKENSFLRVIGVGVVAWLWMKSYILVCIEFFGSIIS
jgi:hypothetical protein